MRQWLQISTLVTLLAGCAHRSTTQFAPLQYDQPATASPGARKADSAQQVIVTPNIALTGKVTAVNANARFVVLNFPIGRMPAMEQRLSLYRNGLKVGEVKITGPQRDDNTVADIISGESQIGDEVREH